MLKYKLFKYIAIVLFMHVCLTTHSFSQNNKGIFQGEVKDSTFKKGIEFASIRLFNANDSSLISGDFTDSLGRFKIKELPFGNYYAVIDFLGYDLKRLNTISISVNEPLFTATILLKVHKETTMDEVQVVGKQNAFEIGLDKKVYNVGSDLSTKGGSVNDILLKVPSVDVDQDGKVSLRGDGNVTILIDGRPSSMTGGNGKSLLDAIPASSIERIEIISNPSAKYDPDGTSGIINIVLKKNKLKGTNGMISTTVATGNILNSSMSFSVRNSKINSYVNYSYKYMEGYRNNWGTLQQLNDDVLTSKLVQNRLGTDNNINNLLKLGTDFYVSTTQTIGFSVSGSIGSRATTGDLVNKLYNGTDSLTRFWTRSSNDPTKQQNFDMNVNHKIEFKNKKGTLESNFTQSIGENHDYGYYNESYLNADSTLNAHAKMNQQLTSNGRNDVFTGQTDFVRVFDKTKARFEAGAKAIIRNMGVNSNFETLDTLTNVYLSDTSTNFDYKYNEQIYSAYTIYGQQKGKWKYQGGLRFEQSYQIPFLVSKNEKYTNDYFNIFPSGHVKYNNKGNSEWSLSYSRRINRANSENLNPFTSYADPFNLRKGNPALKPEYISSFDLGYFIEKSKITMTSSIYYRYTTNVIQRVKIFYPDNTSTVTYTNIDQSQSGGLELVISYKPYKWWRNTISFNGSFIKYADNTPNFNYNNSGINITAKYVGAIEYWKKTMTTQLNIQYNAPQTTAQGIVQRRGAVELSTEKSLYKGKWSVGLRMADIFNRQGFSLKVRQPTIIQDSEFKWQTRRLYFTISYKFGKVEFLNKQKSSSDSGGGNMEY